jgi:imidazolonepropionase-like amidohydrolase
VLRIDADLLIPGRGAPVRHGAVVVDGATIAYAGPAAGAPVIESNGHAGPTEVKVPVVMPGLWDCHGHFLGEREASMEGIPRTHLATAAARSAGDALLAVNAGFTSVREPGGLGVHLARAIDEGSIPGPRIYAAGDIISTTGGHGDLHGYPIELVRALCHEHRGVWLADGVDECLKAVRTQLRQGARLIKVCASGGIISEIDSPLHQQFSREELRVIAEEAGRAERVVAAHCHGKAGILAALEAGCRTIEHGSFLDEETAAAMVETGTILVPTRMVFERLLAAKGGLPDYAAAKLRAISDRHLESLDLARRRGVRIACGTDIFTSGSGSVVPWGANSEELTCLVEAGFTPLQAIEVRPPLSLRLLHRLDVSREAVPPRLQLC